MEIVLFQVEGGWGYMVGNVYQPYDPDCEGFVPMTKERAQQCAETVLQRLEK